MKTSTTLALIAIYIISMISVPFAFAEENTDVVPTAVDTTAVKPMPIRMRAQAGDMPPPPPDSDRPMLERRQISKARLTQARERYVMAKEEHKEIMVQHRERKAEFGDSRKELRACQESGEDCTALEEKTFEDAQQYLIEVIDRMINKLEEIKARMESAEGLTDNEEAEGTSNIDRVLNRLEELRAEAEAATTKEELQRISREVRKAWSASQKKIKHHTYRMIGKKVGLVVKQAELLDRKLSCAANGTDVDVSGYEELVAKARAEFEAARAAWDGSEGDVEAAREHIKTGHEYLKEAHELVRGLVTDVREDGGSFEGCGFGHGAVDKPESDDSDDADEAEDEEEAEDEVECSEDKACPAIVCVTEPCPQQVCVNGECELEDEEEEEEEEEEEDEVEDDENNETNSTA